MRRAVGDAVREGGVRGQIGLPLIGQITPLTHGLFIAGERIVRPRDGQLAADGAVQGGRDA